MSRIERNPQIGVRCVKRRRKPGESKEDFESNSSELRFINIEAHRRFVKHIENMRGSY